MSERSGRDGRVDVVFTKTIGVALTGGRKSLLLQGCGRAVQSGYLEGQVIMWKVS